MGKRVGIGAIAVGVAIGDIETEDEESQQPARGTGVGVGVRVDVGRVGVNVEYIAGVIDTGAEGALHPVKNIKIIPMFVTIRCNFSFSILASLIG